MARRLKAAIAELKESLHGPDDTIVAIAPWLLKLCPTIPKKLNLTEDAAWEKYWARVEYVPRHGNTPADAPNSVPEYPCPKCESLDTIGVYGKSFKRQCKTCWHVY